MTFIPEGTGTLRPPFCICRWYTAGGVILEADPKCPIHKKAA